MMQDVNHQLFSDSVWNECELAQPDCPPERIEEILRSFDLLDFKDRHPMALSGGQKQRLAVATAILSDKDVLVFDEPYQWAGLSSYAGSEQHDPQVE